MRLVDWVGRVSMITSQNAMELLPMAYVRTGHLPNEGRCLTNHREEREEKKFAASWGDLRDHH
jgi:hypothetical protein